LKKRSHYEVSILDFQGYKEASHQDIKLHIYKGQNFPPFISEDPYKFLLHNGIGDNKDMIEGLGFEELANDLLFPLPGIVSILNSRQNRGELSLAILDFSVQVRIPQVVVLLNPASCMGTCNLHPHL
jgi:hypothetical protein